MPTPPRAVAWAASPSQASQACSHFLAGSMFAWPTAQSGGKLNIALASPQHGSPHRRPRVPPGGPRLAPPWNESHLGGRRWPRWLPEDALGLGVGDSGRHSVQVALLAPLSRSFGWLNPHPGGFPGHPPRTDRHWAWVSTHTSGGKLTMSVKAQNSSSLRSSPSMDSSTSFA